ncbi:MAG TPA: hypothetical protein VHV08_10790 [Pirellulales bacterium]|nr:hypothetical protein [Pirellulales bacterium]
MLVGEHRLGPYCLTRRFALVAAVLWATVGVALGAESPSCDSTENDVAPLADDQPPEIPGEATPDEPFVEDDEPAAPADEPLEPEATEDSDPGDDASEGGQPDDASANESDPDSNAPDAMQGDDASADEVPRDEDHAHDDAQSPPATTAEDGAAAPNANLDASLLSGVQPGATTRVELEGMWGSPARVERIAGGVRAHFKIGPFDRVRVTIVEEIVESVAVQLSAPLPVELLATPLGLGDFEPVEVWDERGEPAGQAYPERGILLGMAPPFSHPRVHQIMMHRVDATAFLARAEMRLSNRFVACQDDLDEALRLAPKDGRVYGLAARLALKTGELASALKSSRKAVELAPADLELRLTLAKVLEATGDDRAALRELRKCVAERQAPAIVLAQAYCQWGDCLAAGPKPDMAQAIKLHTQAIQLAESLAAGQSFTVRRSAKELLVAAHLAVAYDIGYGHWQDKPTVCVKWIDRAMALADDAIAHDRCDAQLKLYVHEQALRVLAGIEHPPDANRWIRGATQLGAGLLDETEDPPYKAYVAWGLATALGDAVEIEAARDHWTEAFQLGKLAMACFEQGAAASRELPGHDYARGRLCYRLGAIEALERRDHRAAVTWFDQAVPQLNRAAPSVGPTSRARDGQMFVSMAISYWEANRRSEAMQLTARGTKLLEQAAAEGLVARAKLAVAYGNLASMHEKLGHASDASRYSVKAASYQEKAPPAVSATAD